MKTATKPSKKTTTSAKKPVKKKPSTENTGNGKNNPTATDAEDTDKNQYQNIDSGKSAPKDNNVAETNDESDNVGKDINYK